MKKAALILLVSLVVFNLASFGNGYSSADRYIVIFEGNEIPAQAMLELKGQGLEVKEFNILNGIVVTANENAIYGLSRRSDVRFIEKDVIVNINYKPNGGKQPPAQENQVVEWGVYMIEAPDAWFGFRGNGVKVAVIDTGIDVDHPDLSVYGGVTYVKGSKSYDDDNGHGTHVAGIVAAVDNAVGVVGVAPNAELYSVKVLNNRGSGYVSDVIRGIEWSINHNMDVINMSLGSNAGVSALEDILNVAKNSGIITVAAAGNDGAEIDYPGAYSSTIAVGAIDRNMELAYFSSIGPELDVVAPGVGIKSTYKGGGYKSLSGTSMATPHITGLAALFKEKYPGVGLDEFRAVLNSRSFDLGVNGFDILYGNGLPSAVEILK